MAPGTPLTELTLSATAVCEYPHWSPDGRQIAFAEVGPGQPFNAKLLIMNADGSGLHAVPTPGLNPTGLSWSPDGSRLVIAVSPSGLAIVNPNTGAVNRIRTGASGGPDWSPDGSTILFNDNEQLMAMDPDG